jgi:hypothetical protein
MHEHRILRALGLDVIPMILREQIAAFRAEARQQSLPGLVQPRIVGGEFGIGANFFFRRAVRIGAGEGRSEKKGVGPLSPLSNAK